MISEQTPSLPEGETPQRFQGFILLCIRICTERPYIILERLKNAEAFKAWIMKILFAKIKKRQREYMNSGAEISPESLYVGEFDFESSELREAVCLLDDESRAILSLSVLGGYKSMEIAEISGIKASTVRSKLSRIKEKLRLSLCE